MLMLVFLLLPKNTANLVFKFICLIIEKNSYAFLFPIDVIQFDYLRVKYQTHEIRKSHMYLNMENASSRAFKKTDNSMTKTSCLQ